MSQLSKTEQVIKQMIQYKIDILALSEVRWTGMGEKRIDKEHTIIYSGNDATRDQEVALLLTNVPAQAMISWTPVSSRIITARFLGFHAKLSIVACYAPTNEASTEDKQSFYNELVGVFKDIPRHDVLCLLGDLNAKIGNDYTFCPEVLGKHGIGERNDNGELLIDFALLHDLVIGGKAEDTSSNDDTNIFVSVHPMLFMENEVDFTDVSPGISADSQHDAEYLKLESNIDGDKGLPGILLCDNDDTKEGCDLPSQPGLATIWLKQEVDLNCQNEMQSQIYVFTESDVIKQEVLNSGKRLFECDMCKKWFTTSASLSRHQRTHTGEKPFGCNICKKTYYRKADLSIHQRTHTGEKPFECGICKKRFTSSNGLSNHQRTHTEEKPFECNICEKTFRRKADLLIHHRAHTGEKPFECDICKKCFAQSASLSDHQRTHTGEKPFECYICKKCYTSSSSLSNHQRTHTRAQLFECDIWEDRRRRCHVDYVPDMGHERAQKRCRTKSTTRQTGELEHTFEETIWRYLHWRRIGFEE
ncbi:hypothetical protein QYM36_002004 [Artemia franciscana]|uniref:C2H2-type domain-containing protein n=1 Tax=Artemia franciscana TaxID=6661 RepID=A0AA88I3W4_ARTSF|nr:hypothetical protein QYM36_002004 [Artemia franciscana]